MKPEEIAIIGMAGRFPGAKNVDEFWQNLVNGVVSIRPFTADELKASGVSEATLKDPAFVNAGAVMDDADAFDASFFGFSAREAEITDPQQRVFLECAWEAMENAGYDPEKFEGLVGVFGGVGPNTYFQENLIRHPDLLRMVGQYSALIGSEREYAVTRVSFKLNLKGPSVSINTACSTSGVAIHYACQSLLNGECDIALAGGARIKVPLKAGYLYEDGGIRSPDGHCRTFDAEARGTVAGSGVAMIVLKRLSDAIHDGDSIHAVIKGSAVNNDGSLKVGFTAPSIQGQAAVIEEALAMANVHPDTIGYIEAHGTGTPLGDPIEFAALTKAFRRWTNRKKYCPIGSVKTNIGHLDAGAGLAGVIKTALSLKYKQVPPSLNFEKPNPQIDFENSPFYVNTNLSEWPAGDAPRRVGVSSFGLGGTNAHIILEESPETEPSGPSRPHQLLLLSAKSNDALEKAVRNLAGHLKQHPELNLADVAYTLQVGRRAFNHRRMVVCQNLDDAVTALETLDPKRVIASLQDPINRDIVFMFSAQGTQYVNMGLELYRTESQFREPIDHCSEILEPHLGLDLRTILYPAEENIEESVQKLNQTFITQPALFIIEYALAKLWMSWGIRPSALVGHSIGEYVAACLAGVFSLEDALPLVATRGRLMQQLLPGSMLAVRLSEKEIQQFLNENLSLSAVNSPSLCVVSGEKAAIEKLERKLSGKKVDCRHLHTSHAFHSNTMDPIIDTFAEHVKQVRMHTPQIPFLSNLNGTWITSGEAMNPSYWANHLRQPVLFSDCVGELLREPKRVLLEVGPGHSLSTLARQHPNKTNEHVVLSSIRHPKEQTSDTAFILNTLGRLWLAGIQVDWSGLYKDERRHRIPLPTYPFERKRYWIEPVGQPRGFFSHRALTKKEYDSQRPTGIQLQSDYLSPGDSESQSDCVVPRNEVEGTIAEIWQRLLGVKQISKHDNYFDLGGDSLLAVGLCAQIEKIFGKKIPPAILFEAPTVEQLAGIVSNEDWSASWSSLVEIQSKGSKPPFFCVHGAGGNVLIYHDLARHLGPDQPVYGLQSKGLDGQQPFHTTIEDMASHFLKEIKNVQPEGPYLLGGYCLGGTIALEMAQQLHAEGQEVPLLVFWETYNWANLRDKSFLENIYYYLQRFDFHFRNFLLLKSEEKLTFVKEKAKVAKGRSNVWSGMITSKIGNKFQLGNEQYSHLFDLWKANDRAALEYVPKVYPGRITQFLPIKEYRHHVGPELGWDELAAGGLETYRLSVYPAGMLVEPFVLLLAEKLKACIDRASKQRQKNTNESILRSKAVGNKKTQSCGVICRVKD